MIFKKLSPELRQAKKMGVTHVKISTAFDNSVCETCQRYEGKIYPINKVPTLPLCPTCRCAYIYLFPEDLKKLNTSSSATITHDQALRETIRREIEIMNDCVELVNNSCNFSTVVHRYDGLIRSLTKLSRFTPQELQIARVSPRQPFSASLKEIQTQKDAIFNQAIQRAYDRTVEDSKSLKTEKGRQNRLEKLKASILGCSSLSDANIAYVNSLFVLK